MPEHDDTRISIQLQIELVWALYIELTRKPQNATELGVHMGRSRKQVRRYIRLLRDIYGVTIEYDPEDYVWRISRVPYGVDTLIRTLAGKE